LKKAAIKRDRLSGFWFYS